MSDTTIPTSQTGTDRKRSTLIFTCDNCDQAFGLIRSHSQIGYWAQIVCLADGKVELHLRPLEEKDY